MDAAIVKPSASRLSFGSAAAVHVLFGLGMVGVIVGTFLAPNPDVSFGEPSSARLMVFHVPCHWVAFLMFLGSMAFAIRYLRRASPEDDLRSTACAEIGLLFALLGTMTGAVFAGRQWRTPPTWYHWDFKEVRMTSIFVVLLMYAAYFALRSAIVDDRQRAVIAAVYAIIGFISALYLMFVLPRVTKQFTLHPNDREAYAPYRAYFLGALLTYTWLAASLWSLRVRAGSRSLLRENY